ncbi:MAG: hypothetical protein BGO09_11905 [Bacteroidetes bacterium 47-18]|nr:MAG: hypothetical protein BGO09_11905 [Bacteroidetes bacterium 47-18]
MLVKNTGKEATRRDFLQADRRYKKITMTGRFIDITLTFRQAQCDKAAQCENKRGFSISSLLVKNASKGARFILAIYII